MGIQWTPTPIATLSSPRGLAHPCVYRGFCVVGCSTNAKQSVLVTWILRAIDAGAEIRDLAMVGRVEMSADGRATGVHYYRSGGWHFQRARHVVVARYSIETPRLLLNSACTRFPSGLANRSGLVGKRLMVHANNGVFAEMDEESCDGSLFPTGTGVNPSLTIMALACRIGDRIVEHARRGELDVRMKSTCVHASAAAEDSWRLR